MKYELVMTDFAALDLVGIVSHIAKESVLRANKYHDDIIAKLKKLETEPLLGRPHTVKKFKLMGYRELIVGSHTAHYTVDNEKRHINIIRVLHQSMKKEKHLKN